MSELIGLENLSENYFKGKKTIVAIGFFDGVHLGHKKIIDLCVRRAREIGGVSVVLTFDKPPVNLIKGKMYKKLITSFEDKIKLIEGLGVDFIVTSRFDANFSNLKPDQFCKEILIRKFYIEEIFIGEGFHFGRERKGNDIFLKKFFKSYKVKVNIISLYKVNGIPISSTIIRKYFFEGDLEKIRSLLGRYPKVVGTIIKASGRGRKLGFPTANIDVFKMFVIPKDGVYLGNVEINGNKKKLPAIVNVGNSPTFNDTKKWIEAFIINFNEDIYNKEIKIYFLKRLRDEIIFDSQDKLIEQIKLDLEDAIKYFKLNCIA